MSVFLRNIPLFFESAFSRRTTSSTSLISKQQQQTNEQQPLLEEAQQQQPQEQRQPNGDDHALVAKKKGQFLSKFAEEMGGSTATAEDYISQFQNLKEDAVQRKQCSSILSNALSPEDDLILKATKELHLQVRQVKAIFGIGSGRYQRIFKKSRPTKKLRKYSQSTIQELEYFVEKNLRSPEKNRTLFLRYQQKDSWIPKGRNFTAPLITNRFTFYWHAKKAILRIQSRSGPDSDKEVLAGGEGDGMQVISAEAGTNGHEVDEAERDGMQVNSAEEAAEEVIETLEVDDSGPTRHLLADFDAHIDDDDS